MTETGGRIAVPTALGRVSVATHGDGRPTLLWHSMFVDGTSWDELLPLLGGDRRLLVVDGPGYGWSDPLRRVVGVSESVRVAEQVVNALAPGEPVDWVGNAWGGHVGMELAATRPALVRSLVAISAPTQPIDAAARRRIQLLIPVLRAVGPVGPVRDAVLTGVLTDASRQQARIVDIVQAGLARPSRASLANTVRSFILNRIDIAGLLPRIQAPSLFVAGSDRGDWTPKQAAAAAALVSDAETTVVSGGRTLIPLEQPAALARTLLDFWARLDARQRR